MRQFKKVISAAIGFLLLIAVSAGVLAEAPMYTITINNSKSGHTYQAYQIFTGDLDKPDQPLLTNVDWGSGVNSSALLTELGTNDKFKKSDGSAPTSANDVASILEENPTLVKEFAQIAGKHLASTCQTLTYNESEKTYSAQVPVGYYLIKDQDDSLDNKPDAYTEYIIKVVKDITVAPKGDAPTVEKKVLEDQAGGWQDAADYDMGDSVPFKLTGTLPDNYAEYQTYQYKFVDTLSPGLTADTSTVKVYIVPQGETVEGLSPIDASYYTVSYTDNELTVSFANLKNVKDSKGGDITKNTRIVVEYKATLNQSAQVGSMGNPNTVHLEFSNNPNANGGGDIGKTPDDKVVVYTYQLKITKKDGETDKALSGAEFILYKDRDPKEYAIVENGEVTGWTTTESEATKLISGEDGVISIIGLDHGTYYLKETQAPSGYNILKEPVKLIITVVKDQTQEKNWDGSTSVIQSITLQVDNKAPISGNITTGMVEGAVYNFAGAILPETGGSGTTVIYVVGVLLVLGAGLLMLVRKRKAE